MFLKENRERIEKEFDSLRETLKDRKYPMDEITRRLEECEDSIGLAMKYLYITAPYSDFANYPFDTILQFAKHGVFLYENLESVRNLPEELFLNYVLQHRVNEEEVIPCREEFWNLLKDRVSGKSQMDAAIEVNFWCAEEATYHSGDSRTLAALTVYKRGYGRCGEESVLLVNALRSVGIPARQVYVPRWSHCDDNHAWVELWCDGKWHFTGACEPLMILDKGWFTSASSRAMMVHSRWFDSKLPETENIIGKKDAAAMLNQLERYAITKKITVKVTDAQKNPVKGVKVSFQILNYAEYFSAAEVMTDENGCVSLVTGLGTVRVQAYDEERQLFGSADMDVRSCDSLEITLAPVGELGSGAEEWKSVDIIAPVDAPVNTAMPTKEQKEEGTKRLNEANAIRKAKKENWVNPEKLIFLQKTEDAELRKAMMEQLSEKDGTDCISSVLEEHLEYAKAYAGKIDDALFMPYILNPRIEDEVLRCYRKGILEYFTEEQKNAFCENPISIWNYIQENIKEYSGHERASAITTPYECLRSGLGTVRSQKVLFVAIARTLGIPARLNPLNTAMEYWMDDQFLPVIKDQKKEGLLILKKEADSSWTYFQHWSIGQLINGEFVSLDLTNTEWDGDEMRIPVVPGLYRLITTNRLPNGNQFAYEKYVSIGENGEMTRTETLLLRKAELSDMLERINLPEFEVGKEDGTSVTCEQLTADGKKILMWLEESCEPTEHILNEMLEQKEKFHEFEKNICFMVRTKKAKEDELVAKVLGEFQDITVYYDSFEENIELLGRRMYVDPDKLPLILVTNGVSTGIYATSGYNVGTGDMLIRIMNEVPEAK
nr:transglutaminase domain-containing protein [uncultured Blautia sp.]